MNQVLEAKWNEFQESNPLHKKKKETKHKEEDNSGLYS